MVYRHIDPDIDWQLWCDDHPEPPDMDSVDQQYWQWHCDECGQLSYDDVIEIYYSKHEERWMMQKTKWFMRHGLRWNHHMAREAAPEPAPKRDAFYCRCCHEDDRPWNEVEATGYDLEAWEKDMEDYY